MGASNSSSANRRRANEQSSAQGRDPALADLRAHAASASTAGTTTTTRNANRASNANASTTSTQQASAQQHKTTTIRNHVNLKKSTLEIVCMDGAPHKIGIKFLADVDKACRASAAFRAKEDATDPGLGQAFAQSVETYVDTKAFAAHELITATTDGTRVYPLVIRLECVGDEDDGEGGNSLLRRTHTLNDLPAHPVGGLAANQRWSQSQTTYVELTATPAPSGRGAVTYAAHVLKQKIWVHGASYELQEIYGIDACTPGATNSGDDDGKECVICLSEPRTTTVLPCRHLCMCADCAHTLRSQPSGNVCPICRNPCESLLEIKVASSSGV